MVSNLTTLREYSLPNAGELSQLLSIHSRLERFESVQDSQMEEISRLRQQSILLIQHWYENHILQASQDWSAYEDRLLDAEKSVVREEGTRMRERDGV